MNQIRGPVAKVTLSDSSDMKRPRVAPNQPDQQFGVTDNVEKEDMRDFELDLFLNFGGHLDSHGNARRDDTLK